MGLSNDLISQFAKITNDNKTKQTESTVYGTVSIIDGRPWVKFDGSDRLTPANTTAAVAEGERVTVLVKDHSATITGNVSSPAARNDDVKELGNKIDEFDTIVADKVKAETAEIETAIITKLDGKYATFESLDATYASIKSLEAAEADIDTLQADNVEINKKLTARDAEIDQLQANSLTVEVADAKYASIDDLEATNGKFNNLESTYGEFVDLTTDKFEAIEGTIADLDVESLNAKYANIDFSNIGKAAMENFYANSGLIKDVVVGDQTITGELVGVTIRGDRIIGGSIIADKLVIKGDDGIYYKLNAEGGATAEQLATEEYQNGLHGSNIIANSITAEKIKVDDLVAFDATIGNFNIGDNSIYSGAKASVDNTTRGIYMDTDGQLNFGDSNNYLKFYKDQNGNYKLDISASSLKFGTGGQSVEDAINDVQNSVNNIQVDSNSTNSASGNTPIIINDSADGKVIDLKVYGKTTQDGTELVSVGDSGSFNVDVYGKNLIGDNRGLIERTHRGVTYTPVFRDDGLLDYILVNGAATGGISSYYCTTVQAYRLSLPKGSVVTLSGGTETVGVYLQDNTYIQGILNKGTPCTAELSYSTYGCWLEIREGETANNVKIRPQLEIGTQATEYEPYKPKQTLSFPYHLRGVGDIKDEIGLKRGTCIQKFGEIDLSTLEWSYRQGDTTCWWQTSSLKGLIKPVINTWTPIKALAMKYTTTRWDWGSQTNCIACETTGIIACNNNSATEKPSGLFIYPLATPIETILPEQLTKLHTNDPNTTIIADDLPEMYVEYFRNTNDGKKLAKNADALNDAVNGIEVGARNLIIGSKNLLGSSIAFDPHWLTDENGAVLTDENGAVLIN